MHKHKVSQVVLFLFSGDRNKEPQCKVCAVKLHICEDPVILSNNKICLVLVTKEMANPFFVFVSLRPGAT